MTRYFVYASLLLSSVFSVGLLVLRARPYDNHPILELLPDTCAAPCFLGIYPGITSADDALHLLKISPWVNADSVRLLRQMPSSSKFDDLARIQWVWSAARPDWVIADSPTPDGTINIRNHVVERIAFNTRISAAAIYRNLGNPTLLVFAPIRSDKPWSIEWVYRYNTAQLVMHTEVPTCPYLADLWRSQVYVQMEAKPQAIQPTTTTIPTRVDMRTVLNARKHMVCSLS